MNTDNTAVGCDVTADEVIESCLTEYGIHTHRTKITNIVDGLKPINRRILLVKNDNIPRKVVAITGSVMEKYHPFGDNAITDAIVRMAQPYTTAINLMYSDSNVGDYGGAVEAKGRYLDVGASQFAIDVYFKGIDKNTFEYIPSEIGEGVEPKFLVPKLPMALLVANFGMGLAHKSEPATLNMQDVCKLVINYIKLKTQYSVKLTDAIKYNKLSKYMIPDFPIKVLLRNEDELLRNYANGEFKVSLLVDGTLHLTPNSIIIKTLPYGTKPKDVYEMIGLSRRVSQTNFFNTNVQQVIGDGQGFDECKIVVLLKRGVSPFDILDEFKKTIGFTKRWTPSYLFTTPNDLIEYLDPIKALEYWYEERARSIKAELRSNQRKNIEEIHKLTALIKIGDNILEVVKILRNSNSADEAYPILEKRFGLSKAQTMIIMKYQLSSIPKRGHAELVADLEAIKTIMADLQTKFFNVDKHIVQDAEYFINKYPEYCERKCNGSSFIGYVKIGKGIIQVESISEIIEVLTIFEKQDPSVVLYPVGHKHHYFMNGLNIDDEHEYILPKQMVGDRIVASKHTLKYTIGVGGGTVFRMNKISHDNIDGTSLFYTEDNGVVIYKTGLVDALDPTTLPLRNAIKSRGVNTDIIYVANCNTPEVIVVYNYEPNVIVFEKVRIGGKFNILPKSIAKTTILGVFNTNEPFIISVPDELVNKCSNRHIYVEDSSIFDNGKVSIKLTSKSYKDISVKLHSGAGLFILSAAK